MEKIIKEAPELYAKGVTRFNKPEPTPQELWAISAHYKAGLDFGLEVRLTELSVKMNKAADLLRSLEGYGFTCEAGSLENCEEFITLKELIG